MGVRSNADSIRNSREPACNEPDSSAPSTGKGLEELAQGREPSAEAGVERLLRGAGTALPRRRRKFTRRLIAAGKFMGALRGGATGAFGCQERGRIAWTRSEATKGKGGASWEKRSSLSHEKRLAPRVGST